MRNTSRTTITGTSAWVTLTFIWIRRAGLCDIAVHLRGTLLGGDGLQRINNFMLFALLMPLLALLQNVHIRVLLVLIRLPVFDLTWTTLTTPGSTS